MRNSYEEMMCFVRNGQGIASQILQFSLMCLVKTPLSRYYNSLKSHSLHSLSLTLTHSGTLSLSLSQLFLVFGYCNRKRAFDYFDLLVLFFHLLSSFYDKFLCQLTNLTHYSLHKRLLLHRFHFSQTRQNQICYYCFCQIRCFAFFFSHFIGKKQTDKPYLSYCRQCELPLHALFVFILLRSSLICARF